MCRIWLCYLIMVLLGYSCFAQNNRNEPINNPTVLGAYLDYGNILKHAPSLRQIDDAYPTAIGIEWSKLLLSKKAWDFCNCFPRVGVDLAYWNFDNPDVLGSGILSMGFLEPYFRTQKRTNFFVRAGIGAAYLTNPYDEVSNPLNESYSTRLSFALSFGLGMNYRLTDSWNIHLAAKYNHTSNGGVSTPNKGLNFPSLSLGVNKSLTPVDFPDYNRTGKREPPEQKTRVFLAFLSGWSNAAVGDKDKFFVFGLSANYSRWIGGRSALMGGTEWIFDYSRKEQIEEDGLDRSFAQGSVLIGHEFWWGRVSFSQQLGIYYFNEYRINDDVYQRFGLTYHFNRHFFAGFNLKVHRHVADFFDLRLGYLF
jgi:opacity protein-like surface antigen